MLLIGVSFQLDDEQQLKQVVTEQRREIDNLKAQVMNKDKKISLLEEKIRSLSTVTSPVSEGDTIDQEQLRQQT